MYRRLIFVLFVCFQFTVLAQQSSLTVEKIMRDPKWIGMAPDGLRWIPGGQLYFDWNRGGDPAQETYRISTTDHTPVKVDGSDKWRTVEQYEYDRERSRIVFERDGDIYLRELKPGKDVRLTVTAARESNPRFSKDGKHIIFLRDGDLFKLSLSGYQWIQLTHFVRDDQKVASESSGDQAVSRQDKWLKEDQLTLFDVLKKRRQQDSIEAVQRNLRASSLKPIPIGNASLSLQEISPDERFVTFRLTKRADGNRSTSVPNYVTESGYTEDIKARTKVGNAQPESLCLIYDRQRDTVYQVQTDNLPGIKDLPDFLNDYPERKSAALSENRDRSVNFGQVRWNERGTAAVVAVTAIDNKDRWIMRLNPETGELSMIDRQRDEAWIGGPGIGGAWGGGALGWIDEETIYFQSEVSGYSHIYLANVFSGEKQQLTTGDWEVSDLKLSADRLNFYFTGNIKHPGIKHFYRMPVSGGVPVQITQYDGGNEVHLSPDEKWLAVRHSYSNKPWELYLQQNIPGAKAIKITESLTDEFKAYPWREPEVISFRNRHGSEVYARLYRPQHPKQSRPAVIFVHGAGYLQNAHFWWSQYFREYMFHNLLTDLGYTVMDIDYTGSAGYGRDHRTGIYRHMGGKDLSDQVDGAKLLVDKYGVNPQNIGIYGGSYGGFITLMAMFNEPETFAAGAALRSVTDWAHYNHGYTSNILNEPSDDPLAYKRSSPIYFAQGLKGHLLMCHGMVDVNVHFQDIVRLSQRLIELGKDNWELAVYPVEDHGFVEPSSWTDEYKRILKLFEERLNN